MRTLTLSPPAPAAPLRRLARRFPLLSYFGLAYALSWTLWLPLYYRPLAGWQLPYHHALGAYGPLLAGALLSYATAGRAGLRQWGQGLTAWRRPWYWHALVWLGPLVLAVVARVVAATFGGEALSLHGLGRSDELPELGLVGFVLYNVLSFGVGEEAGWRGYALPRLEQRLGPRPAVLVLTLGWALWHWPLFLYRPGYVHMGLGGATGWLLSLLTGAALLSWLYHRTRGSVLLCAVFHATIDVVFTGQGATPLVTNVLGALITVLGIGAFIGLPKRAPAPLSPSA